MRDAPRRRAIGNHLGNVLATVSDAKLPEARVLSHTDYYAFGGAMPGRSGGAGYRHGFNTQEKSPELAPDHYTAEFWEYDARIGRRWNLDPVVKPHESGYTVMGGNPILNGDAPGDDFIIKNIIIERGSDKKITKVRFDVEIRMTFVDLTQSGMIGFELHAYKHAALIQQTFTGKATTDKSPRQLSILQETGGPSTIWQFAPNATLEVGNVSVNYNTTDKLDDNIKHNNHVVVVVDKIKPMPYSDNDPSTVVPSGLAPRDGEVSLVTASAFATKGANTVAHEFGHNLGLGHPGETLEKNRASGGLMGYKDHLNFRLSNTELASAFWHILVDKARMVMLPGAKYKKSAQNKAKKFTSENASKYAEDRVD